jgi:hypothetical protein
MRFKYHFNVSSSDLHRDNLVLNITDPLRFRSQKLSYLKESVILKPIPRQFPDDSNAKITMDKIEEFMQILGYASLATLIFNLIVQLGLN